MCIVAIAWQVLENRPLCMISNRDEFYHRPASTIHTWTKSPIIAGQDLQSGGSWMGVTASGRWAVITNYREGQNKTVYPTSRGHLIQAFLESDATPIRFAQEIEKIQCDYAGFNLFVGDQTQAVYMSNRGEAPQVLSKGVYVLSNGLLSDDWEKTRHLRKRFTQELLPMLQLENTSQIDIEYAVWDILEDQRKIILNGLPETGITIELEELLSSTFIRSPVYGTRCSNFLSLKHEKFEWLEKIQQGEHLGQVTQMDVLLTQALKAE